MKKALVLPLLAVILAFGLFSPAAMAKEEKETKTPPEAMIQLSPVAVPIVRDGRVINYVFVSIKVQLKPQADAMKLAGVHLDHVLEIDVPFDAIIDRMSGRRVHVASGRTYHTHFNPPKVAGLDDVTGEALIQRDDDKEETVRKRLDVYAAQTRPLVDYYSQWAQSDADHAPRYSAISGVGQVEEIKSRAFTALSS